MRSTHGTYRLTWRAQQLSKISVNCASGTSKTSQRCSASANLAATWCLHCMAVVIHQQQQR